MVDSRELESCVAGLLGAVPGARLPSECKMAHTDTLS